MCRAALICGNSVARHESAPSLPIAAALVMCMSRVRILKSRLTPTELFERGVSVKVLDGMAKGEHTERGLIPDRAFALELLLQLYRTHADRWGSSASAGPAQFGTGTGSAGQQPYAARGKPRGTERPSVNLCNHFEPLPTR
jgi:hypothetical protein